MRETTKNGSHPVARAHDTRRTIDLIVRVRQLAEEAGGFNKLKELIEALSK